MARFRQFRRRFLHFLPDIGRRRRFRNRVLRRFGLARTREPKLFVDHSEWKESRLLPYIAANHVLQNGQLTFLQIGAYDGVAVDDLRPVIENMDVRGILVEPQPEAFARLEELYHDDKRLTLVNAAIDRVPGRRTLYTTKNGISQVASFDRNHLLKHSVLSSDIISHDVPCVTISDVLEQAGVHSIDLLQIDAEGYDYEIIETIDFDLITPAILRFEFSHLCPRDIDECIRMLSGHGYRFIVEDTDILAVRPTVPTTTIHRAAG